MSLTILTIDDTPEVLKITKALLEHAGHNVLEAPDGNTGIELWLMHREIIDLVVVDMEMPVVDGPAVIATILSIQPNTKILAVSGNPATQKRCQANLFLLKPFSYGDLMDSLNNLA